MSYNPGLNGISGAADVFLNNPASDEILSYNPTTGKWQNAPFDKSKIGLGNVENTADANKPISSATQTALNLKAPLASPTFTGTVTVPTPTNATDAATKNYVDAAISGTGGGSTALTTWKGTRAEYDALSSHDQATIYTVLGS